MVVVSFWLFGVNRTLSVFKLWIVYQQWSAKVIERLERVFVFMFGRSISMFISMSSSWLYFCHVRD